METKIFKAMEDSKITTICLSNRFSDNKADVEIQGTQLLNEYRIQQVIASLNNEFSSLMEMLLTRNGGYEKMVFHVNPRVGLRVIACIHDSILGFPLGGTRLRDDYENERAAIIDVADLAAGMSNKAYWANSGTSGGKAIILANPSQKTEAFLEAYGEFLQNFASLISGEDMNMKPADCDIIARRTNFITGTNGKSGDPSPKTAYGVYLGLKSAMEYIHRTSSLKGARIAIQGITGGVGSSLARYCAEEGAVIVGSYHNNEDAAKKLAQELGIKIVPGGKDNPYGIFKEECNILSLNATGKWLDSTTIPLIRPGTIVGGGANNQLADPRDELGDKLFERGIWFLPDFVMNLGGLVNVSEELAENGYDEKRAMEKIEVVKSNIAWILSRAQIQNMSPHRIADIRPKLAIEEARQKKHHS